MGIDHLVTSGTLSLDGGTWDVILDEFKAGQLPNLKRIYDSGVHGVLESRPPILSPVTRA